MKASAGNAVIILNYNDAETTAGLVNKIKNYAHINQIVVVDNCSTDHSYESLRKISSDKVEILKANENRGYAAGNNLGIYYAVRKYKPEFIYVANPDVLFSEEVMLKLEKALDGNHRYGIAAVLVEKGYNVWNFPQYINMIESLFLVWHNLHKRSIKKKLMNSKNEVEKVGVVEGSFFCMRAEVFIKVNGFDERTFLYCEENILAYRLGELDYYECILTGERYQHNHSTSIKKAYGSKAKSFHCFYPSMYLYIKEYLKVGKAGLILFNILFVLGYLERNLYDMIMIVMRFFVALKGKVSRWKKY